jgi:hypothetical protein
MAVEIAGREPPTAATRARPSATSASYSSAERGTTTNSVRLRRGGAVGPSGGRQSGSRRRWGARCWWSAATWDGCRATSGHRASRGRSIRGRPPAGSRSSSRNPPPHTLQRRRAAPLSLPQQHRAAEGVAVEAPCWKSAVRLDVVVSQAVEAEAVQGRWHRPRRLWWRTATPTTPAYNFIEVVRIRLRTGASTVRARG